MYVAVSGDIIAYTSLTRAGKDCLDNQLLQLLALLEKQFAFHGRVIKGDSLEGICANPSAGLQIALIIKCFVKSLAELAEIKSTKGSRYKLFKEYGIRLAVGYGKMERIDFAQGVMDGEAIYHSGRVVNKYSTHEGHKASIKHSLFFKSSLTLLNKEMNAFFYLLDFIIQEATAKQCRVLYYKLLGYKEDEIADILKISQPVVNQQSKSGGWHVIENAVDYFSIKMETV